MMNLNFGFKICVVRIQEAVNKATGRKDLLLVLQRIYDNAPPSEEVYVITLEDSSKQNFLNFLGMKKVEDF